MLKNYVKIHYDSRHTFAFYPDELRHLRLYLLSTNQKYKLMIWTIMLVGIKGFLRTDEVLNLKVEDLPQEYFAVTQNNVEGLCMTVQGKTDQEKEYLAIWDDKECTDLSPSRALLIWLAVTGIPLGQIVSVFGRVKKRHKVSEPVFAVRRLSPGDQEALHRCAQQIRRLSSNETHDHWDPHAAQDRLPPGLLGRQPKKWKNRDNSNGSSKYFAECEAQGHKELRYLP